MKHSEIIDLFGNRKACRFISDNIHRSVWTVRNWKSRSSIPSRHWPALIGLAVSNGIDLKAEDFLNGS